MKAVEQAVCEFTASKPRIVSLEPNALEDIWADIRRVADALAAPERGDQLVARLGARMDAVNRRAARVSHRPSVACVEWIEPLMAAGNWMPELVELAGGVNLFGEAGKHSPWMTWPELAAADPEVIVVSPCGFDLARTMQEMAVLSNRPEWPKLKAVQARRVYLADGNQFFNRPGPRVMESLEIMAEMLHPGTFSFGYEGSGWVRYGI